MILPRTRPLPHGDSLQTGIMRAAMVMGGVIPVGLSEFQSSRRETHLVLGEVGLVLVEAFNGAAIGLEDVHADDYRRGTSDYPWISGTVPVADSGRSAADHPEHLADHQVGAVLWHHVAGAFGHHMSSVRHGLGQRAVGSHQ